MNLRNPRAPIRLHKVRNPTLRANASHAPPTLDRASRSYESKLCRELSRLQRLPHVESYTPKAARVCVLTNVQSPADAPIQTQMDHLPSQYDSHAILHNDK